MHNRDIQYTDGVLTAHGHCSQWNNSGNDEDCRMTAVQVAWYDNID